MVKVIRNEQEALRLMNGTFRVGEINRTYRDLLTGLGEPTFDTPSGDDKIQVNGFVNSKETYLRSTIGKLTIEILRNGV